MIRIGSKPLLQWVIEWLVAGGVTNIVIGVAYQKDKIMNYFGDGTMLGARIRYSIHTVEGGTAEGFRKAIGRYVGDQTFLAMNGDELTDLDLARLAEKHVGSGALATVAVTPLRSPFGVVRLDSTDRVSAFEEKGALTDLHVSIGVYVFERDVLNHIPVSGDVERTTFPELAKAGRMRAYRHTGYWMTVNNLKELQEAEEKLPIYRQRG